MVVEIAGDYDDVTMEEKLAAVVKTHDERPVEPFDWRPGSSAAGGELVAIVAQAESKVSKVLNDPRLPPAGQQAEAAEVKAEAAELVRQWREKHTEKLDAQIEAAIPTPPATDPAPSLAWTQGVERQVEGVDETELLVTYFDPETPAPVCRVLESMAPIIDIKSGKIRPRISDENKRTRWRMEAGGEAVEREAGLKTIAGTLDHLAAVALGELEVKW